MLSAALVSAEVSSPVRPDALRVRERITMLSETVDIVTFTDNHAGLPRMSPLAAVAFARKQGVATVVHVSCRDRNRLALQSQVVAAAALDSEGILCVHGDRRNGIPAVGDLSATGLIASAKAWAAPHEPAVGAVVNPFATDLDAELRLLERKVEAGIDFLLTQMIFDLDALVRFLDRTRDLLAGFSVRAGVALVRDRAMADRVRALPGCHLPAGAYRRIGAGGGLRLAEELAGELAALAGVDGLHVFPLGAEAATSDVAAAFRDGRGSPTG